MKFKTTLWIILVIKKKQLTCHFSRFPVGYGKNYTMEQPCLWTQAQLWEDGL